MTRGMDPFILAFTAVVWVTAAVATVRDVRAQRQLDRDMQALKAQALASTNSAEDA